MSMNNRKPTLDIVVEIRGEDELDVLRMRREVRVHPQHLEVDRRPELRDSLVQPIR